MSARHVLLGDWRTPVGRDAIDLLRLSFALGAIGYLAAGNVSVGVRMALTFLVAVLVRLLDMPRPFDFGFLLGMSLQAWGNAVGLFGEFAWWDLVVHFVLPTFTAPSLYILLARLELVPDLDENTHRRHHLGILIVTFAFGLAVGAIYEMYEWFDDHAFGAHLHVGYDDTISDLLDDAIGSLLGGALLVWWATRGWGTSRRVPERRTRVRT